MHRPYASMTRLCLGIVATVAVLGHICAFSFHAHASELHVHLSDVSVPGPPAHDHEGSDGPDADDSFHGASCDAVRPASSSAVPILPTTARMHLESSTPALHVAPNVRLGVVSSTPPLFLLHAALLI
jgi:hypothetical protein